MKKTIIILILILISISFVSCNNNNNNEYYEEAKKAFEEFYEVASKLETDTKLTEAFWRFDYSDFIDEFVEVTKKERSAYTDLSFFDKFLCYSTYIHPSIIKNTENRKDYLTSLELWNANITRQFSELLRTNGARDEANAFVKLMEWQYDYHQKTGKFFDFLSLNLTAGKTE